MMRQEMNSNLTRDELIELLKKNTPDKKEFTRAHLEIMRKHNKEVAEREMQHKIWMQTKYDKTRYM